MPVDLPLPVAEVWLVENDPRVSHTAGSNFTNERVTCCVMEPTTVVLVRKATYL